MRLSDVKEPLLSRLRSLALQLGGLRIYIFRLSMKNDANLPALFSVLYSYSITSFALGY